MNVLMLVNSNSIGGVVSCVASLSKGLKKYHNDNVIIGILDGEGPREMMKDLNVINIDFQKKNPLGIIRNYRKIKRIIHDNSIEIIHTHNRVPALYAAVYCFFHKSVKYIWSNHLVPIPSDFLHRITTKYGECAVAEGISGQKMLYEKFRIPEEKIKVINLGSPIEEFVKNSDEDNERLKKRLGIEKTEKVIMLYGRLAEVKGHLFLLKALSKLSNRDYKLIFPGGGNPEYKNRVIAKAKEYGLEKNLIFPGYIKGRDYLSICDLMILPSAQEGFGIVNVESFSMGVPVIRTKTGGYEDMSDCCFGIQYGDVKGLTELLEKFFSNSTIFAEQAEYSRKNVNRFSVKYMVEQYVNVYRNAFERNK